ncbi:hypothetical protein EVAR_3817_1 [Eumeta japonica]|uniref:Uncharacterized protein n=1 Tax=Eumeta variegata TaxID=151549 RepID=A0A4C1SRU1_EUMVA|nr:hypothetical protein EVAR_3817_1 [Eumeta japonica]
MTVRLEGPLEVVGCPKNMRTTPSANAYTNTLTSLSSRSEEFRMRFQKIGPDIESWKCLFRIPHQRSAQSPPGLVGIPIPCCRSSLRNYKRAAGFSTPVTTRCRKCPLCPMTPSRRSF